MRDTSDKAVTTGTSRESRESRKVPYDLKSEASPQRLNQGQSAKQNGYNKRIPRAR